MDGQQGLNNALDLVKYTIYTKGLFVLQNYIEKDDLLLCQLVSLSTFLYNPKLRQQPSVI